MGSLGSRNFRHPSYQPPDPDRVWGAITRQPKLVVRDRCAKEKKKNVLGHRSGYAYMTATPPV